MMVLTNDQHLSSLPKAPPFDDSLPWSEIYSPSESIRYDYVKLDSPLGVLTIEWGSWKKDPLFSILINGYWLQEENSLDEAKKASREYLEAKSIELRKFLETRKC